jgi:Ca2+-binding RTX toxin-like protein
VLNAGGANPQALHASSGNETLFGALGSGADTFFGGTGATTITMGTGNDTLAFTDGSAGGTDMVNDFTSGTDKIALQGYPANEVANSLAGQTMNGAGNVSIQFSDGTKVTFAGLGHLLSSSDFT